MKFDVPEIAVPGPPYSPNQQPDLYGTWGAYTISGATANAGTNNTFVPAPPSGNVWHIIHASVYANTSVLATTQTCGIYIGPPPPNGMFICLSYAIADGAVAYTTCNIYTTSSIALTNSTTVTATGGVMYRQEPIV